jgi:hypothetical protein
MFYQPRRVVPKPLLVRFFEGNHPRLRQLRWLRDICLLLGLIALSTIRMLLFFRRR